MENNGFILLARKSIDSDIWKKPPLYWKLWTYILFRAYFQSSGDVERGTFKTSYKELQKEMTYYVGYRKIEPTAKQIRDVIDYLRKPYVSHNEGTHEGQMIVTTKVTNGLLINVVNYGYYQTQDNYNVTTKTLRKSHESHNASHNIYNKELNKEKIKKNNYIFNPSWNYKNELPKYDDSNNSNIDLNDVNEFLESRGKA